MKWIPLDGKKDPIPGDYYLAIGLDYTWDKLKLHEIRITATGKQYEFIDDEGNTYSNCTHYIDISVPSK